MTYERKKSDNSSIWDTLGSLVIPVTAVGLVVSGVVHLRDNIVHSENEIKQQKQDIATVQAYNPEIGSQLTGFNDVAKLVLNPANHTLTFAAKDKTGTAETCKGTYAVHNDAASLAGSIVCTQVTSVR